MSTEAADSRTGTLVDKFEAAAWRRAWVEFVILCSSHVGHLGRGDDLIRTKLIVSGLVCAANLQKPGGNDHGVQLLELLHAEVKVVSLKKCIMVMKTKEVWRGGRGGRSSNRVRGERAACKVESRRQGWRAGRGNNRDIWNDHAGRKRGAPATKHQTSCGDPVWWMFQ